MIAEELLRALRNEEKWAESNFCPREAQFHELYRALGNKKEQDRIREKAERRSCFILCGDASACERLPEDIGEAKQGSPCPNNPFEKEAGLLSELQDQREILRIAAYIDELGRLHAIDPDITTPEEWIVLRIMMQKDKAEQAKMLQSMSLNVVHRKAEEIQES